MYDRRFFSSKLGKAAIISVAAMLAFNVLTLSQQLQAAQTPLAHTGSAHSHTSIELA